jgi:hypothetical protein
MTTMMCRIRSKSRQGTAEVTVPEQPIPEMVGATDRPVVLTGPSEARLSVVPPAGPGLEAVGTAPEEIYLNIENITSPGAGPVTGYDVYLNVPPGEMRKRIPICGSDACRCSASPKPAVRTRRTPATD